MIPFILLEAIFFIYVKIVPILIYILFLPVSFAISQDFGLTTLAVWVFYHIVRSLTTEFRLLSHVLSIFTPVVAISPFAFKALESISPIKGPESYLIAFTSQSAQLIVRFIILYAPSILALVQSLVSLYLIKILCRFLQSEIQDEDRPKILLPILVGTSLAVYRLYSLYSRILTDDHDAQYIIVGVSTLCILVFLSMATLLQPGDNDAPGIEALMLIIYAAFSLTAALSPSDSIGQVLNQISFGIDTHTLDSIFGYFQSFTAKGSSNVHTIIEFFVSAIVGVWHHMPWWTGALLFYRSVIFSIFTSFFLNDTENDPVCGWGVLSIGFNIVNIFSVPLMLLYYGQLIMEAFQLTHGSAARHMIALLGTVPSLVLQLVIIAVLVMRDM